MHVNKIFLECFILIAGYCFVAETTTTYYYNSALNLPYSNSLIPNVQLQQSNDMRPLLQSSSNPFNLNLFKRRCPLCDSSVYDYCSEKLFHDSCCCHNPNNPYDKLPYQCQFADCSFLHANSCYEHKLITACCCTSYL